MVALNGEGGLLVINWTKGVDGPEKKCKMEYLIFLWTVGEGVVEQLPPLLHWWYYYYYYYYYRQLVRNFMVEKTIVWISRHMVYTALGPGVVALAWRGLLASLGHVTRDCGQGQMALFVAARTHRRHPIRQKPHRGSKYI